jgi:anthranilate synthase component 2
LSSNQQILKVLIIDNYDSFTYNLVHLVEQFTDGFEVLRNDEATIEKAASFDKLLFSPGPGLPQNAGVMPLLIEAYASTKSILGVCLGMQAIAENFEAKLYNMDEVLHGVSSICTITDQEEQLYKGLPQAFETGRYHSWAVDANSLPETLKVTAVDEHGIVLSIRHTVYDVKGVQYHPESVMTPQGKSIIANWLAY